MNWAGVVVGVGASFCGRGLFRDGPDQGMWRLVNATGHIWCIFLWEGFVQGRSNTRQLRKRTTRKKLRKRRITKSAVTPTYGGFRRCELGRGGSWGWRIFLWEGVVQGRSRSGHVEVGECEKKKNAKKRRITESAVTPPYGVFRHCELDTEADWGWRIFLWEGFVQGRSKTRQLRSKKTKKKANYQTGRNSNVWRF